MRLFSFKCKLKPNCLLSHHPHKRNAKTYKKQTKIVCHSRQQGRAGGYARQPAPALIRRAWNTTNGRNPRQHPQTEAGQGAEITAEATPPPNHPDARKGGKDARQRRPPPDTAPTPQPTAERNRRSPSGQTGRQPRQRGTARTPRAALDHRPRPLDHRSRHPPRSDSRRQPQTGTGTRQGAEITGQPRPLDHSRQGQGKTRLSRWNSRRRIRGQGNRQDQIATAEARATPDTGRDAPGAMLDSPPPRSSAEHGTQCKVLYLQIPNILTT